MESTTIRSAVIGYGGAFNMGRQHANEMRAAGMTFVAACDLDLARMEQAAEDFPGIHTHTRIEDLLANHEVDLVTVILPHNLHAPVAIQALEAGKHVIVEKPMCNTVAEADAMVDAARAAGKMLSVYHNRRWDGDFQTIKRLIEEGTIGEVFHIEACMGGLHEPGSWWRSDKKISGGALLDWGAHIVDWSQHLIPEPIAGVDGYFHKRRWFERTNEDHTEAVVRFASGKTLQVEISSLAAVGKARWRILGTHGAIVMNGWEKIEVTVDHKGHLAKFEVPVPKSEGFRFYENVFGHLVRGEELVVKPEQARRTIAIIEAAERSSEAQRTVVPAYADMAW